MSKYKRVIIYPYKMTSESSISLAKALREDGINVLRAFPNRAYKYKEGDLVVNWGNSVYPNWTLPEDALNRPEFVSIACDKVDSFRVLYESPCTIPQFETRKDIATKRLVDQDWELCYCRTLLNSHSGKGIVIAREAPEVVDAPLYVQGIVNKRQEFRVHVFNGQVIDYALKRRKSQERLDELGEEVSREIRSFNNGWTFCRESVIIPEIVKAQAILATNTLNLHFAAVDICYQRHAMAHGTTELTHIFELNTAPGLEGTTINRYKNAIKGVFLSGT